MKKVLIIGGSGALGKSVVNTFKIINPMSQWSVMNIDFKENSKADFNYLLKNTTGVISKEEMNNFSKIKFLDSEKLDCVINVAGGWSGGSIANDDILETVSLMMSMNLYSSVLAAHLANKFLNENSLMVLTGANSVKEGQHSWMMGYQLSKNAVHHMTEVLCNNKKDLPNNTKIISILPDTIDTESNRKAMPDEDFSKWTKPEIIATIIRKWTEEKKYPTETYFKF